MWVENKLFKKDLDIIISDNNIDFSLFKDKDILITGSTGLIGSQIVNSLIYANLKLQLNCKIHALVRDIKKAKTIFKEQIKLNKGLILIENDILKFDEYNYNIDYVIHGASQTMSNKFVSDPINTIDTTYEGTKNILNIVKGKNIKSMVFLSSMEVYGFPISKETITEKNLTNLNTENVRSCYPISKCMAENMCFIYASMFGFDLNVARLTQTLGVSSDCKDARVFAEFARCKIENRNIILNTKGQTERNYVYVADAVRAIFTILLYGKNTIYNVANEGTYCSVLEMAELVSKQCSGNNINVIINEKNDITALGYAPILHMNLSSSKLKKLGWQPRYNLKDMYEQLINLMRK